MKLRDITSRVGDKLDLPATTVGQVLDTTLELLFEDLVRTGRLEWRGFGTFTVRSYPARRIHNPSTHQVVSLPERKSITFKPSTNLRARLKLKKTSRHTTIRRRGRAPRGADV